MKKTILLCLLLCLCSVPAYSQVRRLARSTFAELGSPPNDAVRYCTDCQQTSPATGGGAGASCRRIANVWDCTTGSGGGSGLTDGDKGDVTVSGAGSAWVIDSGALAFSELSGSATDAQVPNNITIDLATLATTATTANAGDSAASFFPSGTLEPARLGSGSGGSTKFLREDSTWQTIGGGGDALVANPLSQFAATTIEQLNTVISDADVQPLDGDLTTIAGLSPSNDDFLQRKAGAWAFRTIAQVKTDLAFTDLGSTISEAEQALTDVTTANASTSAHGYLKKLSNISTEFMNGQGNWAVPAGGGDMTLAGSQTVTGIKTFNSATLIATRPRFLTSIDDNAGNPVIGITPTASSVNYLNITPTATGSGPTLSAVGSDTDIDINILPKGAGVVNIGGGSTTYLNLIASVAPSTPAAGIGTFYIDSTSKNLAVLDDAGVVKHGIQTRTATANNWIRSIADDGSSTISQPAFTDISGAATDAQVPNTITVDLAAAVTTNANLTGHVTSTGNTAALGSFTAAQLNTAISDADIQPLDSDLTAIAGLTATTDNFLVSVSSAWASRTPAQVRTTLALVIGTNVQAYDADLDDLADGSLTGSKVSAASDTASGGVELATIAETSTGTDTVRAVTPDGLAGSTFGERAVELVAFDFTVDTATGDGKMYFVVPASLNGMNLVAVAAQVITAGTTNATNVDLARCATAASGNACSGTVSDMLSTNATIDSGENSTATAAAAAVIDTSNDDVATGQLIRVDVDAVSTTAAKGLILYLTFRLP